MKKTLCILFSLILTLTGLVGLVIPAGAKGLKTGDIIELGSYPQTQVKDEKLLEALKDAAKTWIPYNYYFGTSDYYDGQMAQYDWVQKFTDVTYNGLKYRGVMIYEYRACHTGSWDTSSNASYQDDNGYKLVHTYWFSYEPLKWRVLDPSTGLVMSEYVIDSQAFNNYVWKDGKDTYGKTAYWGNHSKTYLANNYERSSLRSWLNMDFRATAFSESQQNAIKLTQINNSAVDPDHSAYGTGAMSDKILLLSYNDIRNPSYGFKVLTNVEDPARKAQGTDYAKCQGLRVSSDGYSAWHLRTAATTSLTKCSVTEDGKIGYLDTDMTDCGVRPAITLDLQAYALYLLKSAQLNVPESTTVGYKSTVTVTAKATGLPDGYFVAFYEDGVAMLQMGGDNTTVTYKMDKMTESKTLTARVIDVDGNVQSNAEGLMEKEITITVKTGFFAKVKAFFQGLFGLLPKITLEP